MVDTRELRVALAVDDFDAAVQSYAALLGTELSARWDQPRGRGGIFRLPQATLEILDGEMAAAKAAPWGDRIARVRAPDGMQLTLFAEL